MERYGESEFIYTQCVRCGRRFYVIAEEPKELCSDCEKIVELETLERKKKEKKLKSSPP
ncbi:MAG: hypothetical protein N3D12_01895 [Candidatus Methanomethyliaceae archaeon]|nr:hypothetical protein [Candidatus Methanomethyliaceae archaeon]